LVDINCSEQKEGDIRNSWADITLAKKYLNFYPKIELVAGIKNLMRIKE